MKQARMNVAFQKYVCNRNMNLFSWFWDRDVFLSGFRDGIFDLTPQINGREKSAKIVGENFPRPPAS